MPRIEFQGQIHEFPDSFTDEQIAEALRSEMPQMQSAHVDKYKAKQERKAALRATLAAGKNLPGMPFGLSDANREMPAALGMAGGAFGGPPGAFIGGATGKALQYGTNPLLGEDQPQGAAPMNLLGEGALQGGVQAGGDALAWILKNAGRAALPLMEHALKAGRGVFKEFPGINPAEVAVEHGIRPEPGHVMPGSKAAEALRIAAANNTDNVVDAAWQGGYSGATPREIARGPGMRGIRRSLKDGPAPITDPAQLEDLIQSEFFAAHPNVSMRGTGAGRIPLQNVMTPPKMNSLRQAAGAQAFAGPDKAQGVMARGATASNYKLYNEGLWKNITAEMEKNVPGFAEANLETQKAMALERAIQAIENPGGSELPHGLWQAAVKMLRGTNVTGRASLAAKAIGKSNRTPVAAEALRQAPRGLSEILRYLSSPSEPDSLR